MIRPMTDAFASLPKLEKDMKILVLTHTDLDGEGAAILFTYFLGNKNVDVKRCSNSSMNFDICNTLSNQELTEQYDMIFATDISCTAKAAKFLPYTKDIHKFVLLDHHASAVTLDTYPWACIQPEVFDDSYRYMDYYDNFPAYTGHSSGTSLVYDYLEYCGFLYGLPPKQVEMLQTFVHYVVAWDTWEWVELYNKDESYNQFRQLFDSYGFETFSERIFQKFQKETFTKESLFDETDKLIFRCEQQKKYHALQEMKPKIRTGSLKIPFQKEYTVVYLNTNFYLNEVFDMMKTLYQDRDFYICNYGSGLSFRTGTNIDLSVFLSEFGGGGHPDAGGISIPNDKRLALISDLFHGEFTLDICH